MGRVREHVGQQGMRWWLGVFWVIGCATTSPMHGPRQAPTTDLYVAIDGSDTAEGSQLRPFATIERARDVVRAQIRAGLSADLTVTIRGGTYYLPEGIQFGPQDSGTQDHSITYRAYRDEMVRLVGGVEITGFRPEEGQVVAAQLPVDMVPHQLFEDGHRLQPARQPDTGYLHMEHPVEGRLKTAFVYRAEDLDLTGVDGSQARVFLWPGHDWFSQDKPVASVDPQRRMIRMTGTDGYDMRPGNRFFLYNVRAFLDRPGECFIDSALGRVSIWPRHSGRIEASTAPSVILVRGTDTQPVRNLHFQNLDIALAEEDAISLDGVADCSVTRCLIENARRNGVEVSGAAVGVTVSDNEIRQNGQHGVALQGLSPPGADVNYGHLIENNHIHHGGRLVGHGYGVRIGQSGRNRVVHNHIHHMPRYGTTIKGIRYQVLKEQVEGVAFENRHDFLHSRENVIAYNDIHDVNMDSQDTGALESWGSGRDNVYDHNLIHDTGNDRFNLQSGIYLDDASDYFTVTNNIIYGVVGTGGDQAIFAKGIGHRIYNNILVVGTTNVAAIRTMTMAGERTDGHDYARNVILFEPPPPPPAGAFGERLRDLHFIDTTLRWTTSIPATGDYALWLRYTTSVDMAHRTQITVDDGTPLTLVGLTPTGGWNHWSWRQVGTLSLTTGNHDLSWVNRDGGGIDLDALVLSDDAGWEPEGVELADVAPGRHLVVIQAEESPSDRRAAYGFINWSDDRFAHSDANLLWNGGRGVRVDGGPGSGAFGRWQALGYDRNSVIGDPLFVDAGARDFRLQQGSPALDLGFLPIDVSQIGLTDDFPTRLSRD
ncbi:MAG: hypothetical protein HN404_26335 [Gemmatimonadetes bacterium]|jgi:hypothetical protein|nr:hypothetical protein [Gemmatimonadota bacterium]